MYGSLPDVDVICRVGRDVSDSSQPNNSTNIRRRWSLTSATLIRSDSPGSIATVVASWLGREAGIDGEIQMFQHLRHGNIEVDILIIADVHAARVI